MTTEAIVDLGIGFVPEGRRLFPRLTVTENLLMGAFRKLARPATGWTETDGLTRTGSGLKI